jgi:S1-C subfamily serine protease
VYILQLQVAPIRLVLAALTAGVLVLTAPSEGQESAKTVFKNASPSVYIVVNVDGNGQAAAFGSGFAVGKHLIATNYHVIRGAARARVFKPGSHEEIQVSGVKGVDTKRDLVLLQTSAEMKPLPLSESKAEVGDTVYAIGNPRGLEATLSSGIVSGLRESDDPKLYQITAPISHGSSGGPVLLGDGTVIGIAKASLESGQNLNFAIEAGHLRHLIEESAGKAPVSVRSVSGSTTAASTPSTPSGDIVYVTATGHSFHRAGCRFLRKSKIPMTRAKAISLGYAPCKICKP